MNLSEKLKTAPLGKTHIFNMGQAGFIFKSQQGFTLGIDLYLSDCVESVEGHDGYHRLMPRIAEPEELQLDFLIATHFHRDHLDISSLKGLMSNEKTLLLCSFDCKKDIECLEIDESRVIYVKPGDHFGAKDYELNFTHSDHGQSAPDEVGVLVSVDGYHILEVGDTSLHLDWKEEYLKKGRIDVLIAPINGAYGNLNELECAKLAEALSPKTTIPCHFGMFASHGGNVNSFISQMKKQNSPYKLLTMGEDWIIE